MDLFDQSMIPLKKKPYFKDLNMEFLLLYTRLSEIRSEILDKGLLPALFFCFSLLLCCCKPAKNSDNQNIRPPNIVFIAVDDLRPELGCYGKDYIHSPHIDQLALDGVTFQNHFVQVPTCGASRYALLTGMYPRNRNHLTNQVIADSLANKPELAKPESFIHHLKRHGYYTVGIGKISHMPDGYVYGYQERVSNVKEMPYSWDEFHFNSGKWKTGHNAFFGYADGSNRNDRHKLVPPYEHADVPDEGYPDGLSARLAVQQINKLEDSDKPFCLAVGFFKPHLPFNAPKKYWDLYDRDDLPLSPTPGIPENVNLNSLHGSGEFNQYALGEEKANLDKNLSQAYSKKLKHAYAASISYVDAQIGKVIQALKDRGIYHNTAVILWGDHGWHLGDHRIWGKHTLFEQALKSPLIIKLPQEKNGGQRIEMPVGSIDLYPTLLDICHIQFDFQLNGESLLPNLEPQRPAREKPVFSYYKNGISMRTRDHRLTKYFREAMPNIELYDIRSDPFVSRNIAAENPDLVHRLLKLLEEGDTGLYNE